MRPRLGELGQLYHAYGFAAAAESAYLEAASGAPTDPRWPHLLGVLFQAEGRLDEAERAYRNELALPGASAAARVQLARVLLEQNRPGEGESTLGPLLDAATVDPAAIACQGEIALALGQHAEAARLLDLALGARSGGDAAAPSARQRPARARRPRGSATPSGARG